MDDENSESFQLSLLLQNILFKVNVLKAFAFGFKCTRINSYKTVYNKKLA